MKKYRTWLEVWLAASGLTQERFARSIISTPNSVNRWCSGKCNISRHYCQLILSLYPDCPVLRTGGPVRLVSECLPAHAREPLLYRFVFKLLGMTPTELTPVELWPKALEMARLWGSCPDQEPVAASQPDGQGIADVLTPADGGEGEQDGRI